MRNRAFENDRYYPVSILDAGSPGRRGLEFMAEVMEPIFRKCFHGGLMRHLSAEPWGLKSVETRVVKGRFQGKEFERLTMFVVVEQQTFYDWKSMEDKLKESVEGGVEGIRGYPAIFRNTEDCEVWLEFLTGLKENAAV